MSLFRRKSIGRLSAIYAFWWNWIWATTIWRTSNPKLLRVTRDCRRWRYPITKLPPCRPTSSPISSTWKASIWATITSKPSSGTHLKTWATRWNRLMWTIIAWVLCVRKFSFRWRTSSRFRWVNIDEGKILLGSTFDPLHRHNMMYYLHYRNFLSLDNIKANKSRFFKKCKL